MGLVGSALGALKGLIRLEARREEGLFERRLARPNAGLAEHEALFGAVHRQVSITLALGAPLDCWRMMN